ncbi:MAG: lysylphosphatidylglycerol synthase transmembrane domain-containing protein [archaeon]|nr:flippase-like domain-containing protein [Candidatus Micrarchaeota archaeon]
MKDLIQKSLISLILVFVVIGIIAIYTRGHEALLAISPMGLINFILACIFFLLGVLLWILSWAYLIRKEANIPYSSLILVGFASLYGALTPIQLGTEALRSLTLKKRFSVPYSKSISASMIVKGTKFLILAVIFSLIILMFLSSTRLDSFAFFALLSGFLVIVLACLLFLLPLSKRIGLMISRFFNFLARDIPLFGYLSEFFYNYSYYLKTISVKSFLLILFLSFLSFIFEFLALRFAFISIEKDIGIFALLVLFSLVSVLERIPLLPRGIGAVEFIGFTYLNMVSRLEKVSRLTVSQIGAVLIIYDVVRLIIPTIISLIIAFILRIRVEEENNSKRKSFGIKTAIKDN